MKKYEIEINYIDIEEKTIYIGWGAKDIGFGVLTINKQEENEFYVETETMGREFYKQVLEKTNEYLLKNSIIVE